jgi:hypothetical protein
VASSFTFVSTGLGDLAGTTADALCRAASSGSLVQRTFIEADPFRENIWGNPYCTRLEAS